MALQEELICEKKENLCDCIPVAFALWTAVVCTVDVQMIGPQGSCIGMATLNCFFHRLTGVHMRLYELTDWLSLIPAGIVVGFGLLGLWQWIERKSLRKVDRDILFLGAFYVAVLATYVFFQKVVVNYRPVLIAGVLEASYPSSTTVLVLCVMPTAVMQLNMRIRHDRLRKCVVCLMSVFTVLMVAGRLISGVHWLSDIIGGAMLSGGLVKLYCSVSLISAVKKDELSSSKFSK